MQFKREIMKKIAFIFCLISSSVFSQRFDYLPKSTGNEIITHAQYSLSYHESHEQAEWVAYELTSREVNKICDRTDDFREDPQVSTGSASLADYKGSGYDRGHLSPAADNKINCPTAMSESFFMSNISPQTAGFNRGVWRRLESLVRDWALKYKKIYIVTGPIFVSNIETIGSNNVTVPGKYYKVILNFKRKEGIGFILSHESSSEPLSSFVVSIDEVENQTGLDFFPALKDTQEAQIEIKKSTSNWIWN